MKVRRVILVAGMPGSGKSVVAEAAREVGIPVLCMGDVVREEARRRGIEITRESLGLVALELRREHGMDAVAKMLFDKISELNSDVALVDGVRSLEEVEFFRREFEAVVLVGVHASPKTRFERLRKRGRRDDPKSWSEFVDRDLRELELGLGSVIALSDVMLINECISRDEALREAREILSRILDVGKLEKVSRSERRNSRCCRQAGGAGHGGSSESRV